MYDPSRDYAQAQFWRGTTILSVRKGGTVVVAGDGQVSMGQTVLKANARKVRRLGRENNIIAGFAGSTASARRQMGMESRPHSSSHSVASINNAGRKSG